MGRERMENDHERRVRGLTLGHHFHAVSVWRNWHEIGNEGMVRALRPFAPLPDCTITKWQRGNHVRYVLAPSEESRARALSVLVEQRGDGFHFTRIV